jgi:RNA polymerase sigma-32 factor
MTSPKDTVGTKKELSMTTTSMNLPALSVASLENYISSVNRIPMLTPEREYELGIALKTRGDLAAASEMVMSHLRPVVTPVMDYRSLTLFKKAILD